MKRIVLCVALAFAMLLTACGNNASTPSTVPDSESTAPGTESAAPNSETWSPTLPVNIVVAASAGGMTDSVARAMAKGMESTLGVSVQVVDMPGGSGQIATEYVLQQPRDGYNINSSY